MAPYIYIYTEDDRAGNCQAELAHNESHLFRNSVPGFSVAHVDVYKQMMLADVRPKQLADDGGASSRLAIDKATFWQQVPMQE